MVFKNLAKTICRTLMTGWCGVGSLAFATDTFIPYGSPSIDGRLASNEWPELSHIRMARFYGSDQFADFWLQWDENNLYIAGLLQDYTLFEDGTGGETKLDKTWYDDSIEIYLHPSAKLPTDPNQNPMLDQNSRVLAFSIRGLFQRLDRGRWVNDKNHKITQGLEILGNTNAKINDSQFLNFPVKWDWPCDDKLPTQPQPAPVVVRFFSQVNVNSTTNNFGARDQDWQFEVALPWDLLGTRVGTKIVADGCSVGIGVIPSKLTPADGMSMRMNFYRINDNDGGKATYDFEEYLTDSLGNESSDGIMYDEWFVYQGHRYHPKEWANFVLSDQRNIAREGPRFSHTTFDNVWVMDGRRVRLTLTAPHHSVSGGSASGYEIRIQSTSDTSQNVIELQQGEVYPTAVDETIWAGMQKFENAYQPAQPGTSQHLDVIGLQPGQTYTIAVRAVDEMGGFSPQILSMEVRLWSDESKFVTVSPTGRNLVFTDGTPFVVVGETALMPWLPLRGLYDDDLCDEHSPKYIKEKETATCGSIDGRYRNYHTEKLFYRCHVDRSVNEKGEKFIDITDKEEDGAQDNCEYVANEKGVTVTGIDPKEGPEVAEAYFDRLQKAGVNVLTVFVESLDLNVTPIFFETSAGQYNPAALKFLDHLVALANQYDVYLILRLYDTFYYKNGNYDDKGDPLKWSDTYWAKQPLNKSEPEKFFDEDLYFYHKNRISQLLGLYKKNPHILGWDLLNEIDNEQRFNSASYEKRKNWVRTMLDHARDEDPYHLLFFSFLTWDPKDDDSYRKNVGESTYTKEPIEKYLGMDANLAYRIPGADMAVPHGYYAHIANPTLPAQKDYDPALELARGIAYGFHQIRDGRPILDGESAPSPLFIEKYDDDKFSEQDDTELFLNSMWLHFVSGGAGANLRWAIDLESDKDSDQDSDKTINEISKDWRALLTVFKKTVGEIPWRGHHMKISRRHLGNDIIAATRYDGRNAVVYFYNPKQVGIHNLDIVLPEVDYGWGEVRAINPKDGMEFKVISRPENGGEFKVIDPKTGKVSWGMLVGETIPIRIQSPFNDHLVLTVQRKLGHLFANPQKEYWSKSTDTHVDILVNAFPFEQEDIYFWLEDSHQQRQYFSEQYWDSELITERRPVFRKLSYPILGFPKVSWGVNHPPLIRIPMWKLREGQYTIGIEVGTVESTDVFTVIP